MLDALKGIKKRSNQPTTDKPKVKANAFNDKTGIQKATDRAFKDPFMESF